MDNILPTLKIETTLAILPNAIKLRRLKMDKILRLLHSDEMLRSL